MTGRWSSAANFSYPSSSAAVVFGLTGNHPQSAPAYSFVSNY